MNSKTCGCCGLFCEACDIYQSVQSGTLKDLAAKWEMNPEDLACDGCRSERRSEQSRKCYIRKCCLEKGHDHCGECGEFPCQVLKEFADNAAPHTALTLSNCLSHKEVGRFEWYLTQKQQWSCSCGQMFSWYQAKCSRCGKRVDNILLEEDVSEPEQTGEEGLAAGE